MFFHPLVSTVCTLPRHSCFSPSLIGRSCPSLSPINPLANTAMPPLYSQYPFLSPLHPIAILSLSSHIPFSAPFPSPFYTSSIPSPLPLYPTIATINCLCALCRCQPLPPFAQAGRRPRSLWRSCVLCHASVMRRSQAPSHMKAAHPQLQKAKVRQPQLADLCLAAWPSAVHYTGQITALILPSCHLGAGTRCLSGCTAQRCRWDFSWGSSGR